jgi:hypothetical protein
MSTFSTRPRRRSRFAPAPDAQHTAITAATVAAAPHADTALRLLEEKLLELPRHELKCRIGVLIRWVRAAPTAWKCRHASAGSMSSTRDLEPWNANACANTR